MNPNQDTPANRRHSERFPIERDVRYRLLGKKTSEETGVGRTVDISSRGVLFTAEHALLQGLRLELSISWPALLNNSCGLKLVAQGYVVRLERGRAAMEIQKYEFRTHSSGTGAVPDL